MREINPMDLQKKIPSGACLLTQSYVIIHQRDVHRGHGAP